MHTNHKFYFSHEKCGKSIKNPVQADDGKERHLWEVGPKVKQKLWRHRERERKKATKITKQLMTMNFKQTIDNIN